MGNYVSRLRVAGYLDESEGTFAASEAGLAAMGDDGAPTPQTRDEIIEQWKRTLGNGPAKMIDVLTGAYPGSVSRDDLADATSMAASGGTFGTYLSRLTANLVVTIDKNSRDVRMADTIMEA